MQYYVTITEDPQKLNLSLEELKVLIQLGTILAKYQNVEI